MEIKDNKSFGWGIIFAILLFLYNAMNFLILEGNTNKLSSALFNMIIIISLLIFLIHKKYFDCPKEELKQMTLEKYFK